MFPALNTRLKIYATIADLLDQECNDRLDHDNFSWTDIIGEAPHILIKKILLEIEEKIYIPGEVETLYFPSRKIEPPPIAGEKEADMESLYTGKPKKLVPVFEELLLALSNNKTSWLVTSPGLFIPAVPIIFSERPSTCMQRCSSCFYQLLAEKVSRAKRYIIAIHRQIMIPSKRDIVLQLRTIFRILKLHPHDGKEDDTVFSI